MKMEESITNFTVTNCFIYLKKKKTGQKKSLLSGTTILLRGKESSSKSLFVFNRYFIESIVLNPTGIIGSL